MNRRKPNIKNRVEAATEAAITAFGPEQPAFGRSCFQRTTQTRNLCFSVWCSFGVVTPESGIVQKRLSAFEKYVAETGRVLTEAQVQAQCPKEIGRWCGPMVKSRSVSSWLPGVGIPFLRRHHQGRRRIYQQTFVDTYSKWAAAKLYTHQNTNHSGRFAQWSGVAQSLPNKVWASFASQPIAVLNIAASRNIMITSSIWHWTTLNIPKQKPIIRRPNGICSVSTKPSCGVLPVTFRRKIYQSIGGTTARSGWLDSVLQQYAYSPRKDVLWRYPMQTLIDAKEVWDDPNTTLNNWIWSNRRIVKSGDCQIGSEFTHIMRSRFES